MKTEVETFFDHSSSTFSYVVHTGVGSQCAVIDSVLGYHSNSGKTDTVAADEILAFIHSRSLTVEWILETHIHADHLSAAAYIKRKVGGCVAASRYITDVITTFDKVFYQAESEHEFISHFDHLFEPNESFHIGTLPCKALSCPGHTPACIAYVVDEAIIFVGDTLFMPDVGTARCDFPDGSAEQLYASIRRILSYPDETMLMMCHDYPPSSRLHCSTTTVAEQRQNNIHVNDTISEQEFIELRNRRDRTLDSPQLLFPSVQVNIRAGEFPAPERNGLRYLKVPLDL